MVWWGCLSAGTAFRAGLSPWWFPSQPLFDVMSPHDHRLSSLSLPSMGRLLGHGHDFLLLSHRQHLHRPDGLQDDGSLGSYHRLHRTPLQLLHQVRLQGGRRAPRPAPLPRCSLQPPQPTHCCCLLGQGSWFPPRWEVSWHRDSPCARSPFLSTLNQVALLTLQNMRVNFTWARNFLLLWDFSPRVLHLIFKPGSEELARLLRAAPERRVWTKPDCFATGFTLGTERKLMLKIIFDGLHLARGSFRAGQPGRGGRRGLERFVLFPCRLRRRGSARRSWSRAMDRCWRALTDVRLDGGCSRFDGRIFPARDVCVFVGAKRGHLWGPLCGAWKQSLRQPPTHRLPQLVRIKTLPWVGFQWKSMLF